MSHSPKSCRVAGVCLLLGLFAAGVPAQSPVIAIHTAPADNGVAYGIWGGGDTYKASFHDGMTFVPYLGRDYPHNQPWSWHTDSVKVGSHELVTQPARLHYEGTRAEYALGGVVEAYDVRPEGLEQTFVLATRPAVGGDLVVRGTVQSTLTTHAAAAAQQSLVFVDHDGNRIVNYGAATAVDATGQTCPMTTACDDNVITLRLDGDWLAQATFPVVVDPLVNGATTLLGPLLQHTDVLHDSESVAAGTWIAAARWASGNDLDLHMDRMFADGSHHSTPFVDITTSWDSNGGSLAYNASSNYVAIVFDRTFASGARALRFHRHHRNDPNQSSSYAPIAASNNAWRADVGGTNLGFSGNQVLAVWQQENNIGAFATTSSSDIYGCSIDLLANTAGTPFLIADNIFADIERPCINQVASGSINTSWLVTYQTISILVSNDDWDVAVHEVTTAGSVSAPMFIANTSPDHKLAPQIAGNLGRYLVTFTSSTMTQQPGTPQGTWGYALRAVRVDWPIGAATGTEPWGSKIVVADTNDVFTTGSLSFDHNTASHWTIVSRRSTGGYAFSAAQRIGYRGELLTSEQVTALSLSSSNSLDYPTSFDRFRDETVIAIPINGSFGSGVSTARFLYTTPPGTTSNGTSCSPATIAWQGSAQIGSEFSGIEVTGSANDSLHILAVSLASAALPLLNIAPFETGCWLNIDSVAPSFLGLFPLQVGANPSFAVPLPETLAPTVFYFQDFHTIGNGNLNMVSTQRVLVPIVK